jgi:hypothetical protein
MGYRNVMRPGTILSERDTETSAVGREKKRSYSPLPEKSSAALNRPKRRQRMRAATPFFQEKASARERTPVSEP